MSEGVVVWEELGRMGGEEKCWSLGFSFANNLKECDGWKNAGSNWVAGDCWGSKRLVHRTENERSP